MHLGQVRGMSTRLRIPLHAVIGVVSVRGFHDAVVHRFQLLTTRYFRISVLPLIVVRMTVVRTSVGTLLVDACGVLLMTNTSTVPILTMLRSSHDEFLHVKSLRLSNVRWQELGTTIL